MTKEQLLASLKPLWWSYDDSENELHWMSTAHGLNRDCYHISKRPYGFLLYQVDSMTHFEKLHDVIYETDSLARFAAQEHYNNMVLELFNIGEPQ